MHLLQHLPHRLRKQTPFHASLTEEYPQRDVITSELGTCILGYKNDWFVFKKLQMMRSILFMIKVLHEKYEIMF